MVQIIRFQPAEFSIDEIKVLNLVLLAHHHLRSMLEDCSPWLAVACIGPADDWNFVCDEFPCASLTVAEPAENIRKSLLVTILGYGLSCT
mgnify:CR=1 FL=1